MSGRAGNDYENMEVDVRQMRPIIGQRIVAAFAIRRRNWPSTRPKHDRRRMV
jgi:hypothetical protein